MLGWCGELKIPTQSRDNQKTEGRESQSLTGRPGQQRESLAQSSDLQKVNQHIQSHPIIRPGEIFITSRQDGIIRMLVPDSGLTRIMHRFLHFAQMKAA